MKWNAKPDPRPLEVRTVTRFAFFPKRIGDKWVWLETFQEFQQYTKYSSWAYNKWVWSTIGYQYNEDETSEETRVQ
jgi:hypothetical protein